MTEVNDDLIWNNLLMGRVKYNTNDIRIEYETKLKKKEIVIIGALELSGLSRRKQKTTSARSQAILE